jgi:hypothetical protein
LWRGDDHPAKIHGCRIVAMHFFRFFLTPPPKRPFDMHQHVAALVCPSPAHQLPRTHLTAFFAATSRPAADAADTITVVPQYTFSFIATKLAFNPHNSTRPPQTPAPSF